MVVVTNIFTYTIADNKQYQVCVNLFCSVHLFDNNELLKYFNICLLESQANIFKSNQIIFLKSIVK